MAVFIDRESFIDGGGLATVDIGKLDHDECHICFNTYFSLDEDDSDVTFEEPVQLPCGHILGSWCILKWTMDSNTCPLCRAELFDDITSESTHVNEYQAFAFSAPTYRTDEYPVQYGDPLTSGTDHNWAQPCVETLYRLLEPLEVLPAHLLYQYAYSYLYTTLGFCFSCLQETPASSGRCRFIESTESDTPVEQAMSDTDMIMTDLIYHHEKWMDEYAEIKNIEVDEPFSFSDFCSLQ